MILALILAGIVTAAAAGVAYVAGVYAGQQSSEHAASSPESCRARLVAAEDAAARWKTRAGHYEAKAAELERSVTFTGEWLLGELEQAKAAAGNGGQR